MSHSMDEAQLETGALLVAGAAADRFITSELAVRDWPCGADGNLPDPAFSIAVRVQAAASDALRISLAGS